MAVAILSVAQILVDGRTRGVSSGHGMEESSALEGIARPLATAISQQLIEEHRDLFANRAIFDCQKKSGWRLDSVSAMVCR
jgi:hypothetical protein